MKKKERLKESCFMKKNKIQQKKRYKQAFIPEIFLRRTKDRKNKQKIVLTIENSLFYFQLPSHCRCCCSSVLFFPHRIFVSMFVC